MNNLLGITYIHPWNPPESHALLRTLDPGWSRCSINWHIWTADGTRPDYAGTNPQEFYDKMFELNSSYKIICTMDDVPIDQIATFAPMIIARYPQIWAVCPACETNWQDASDRILAFHAAVPEVRLLGPDLANSADLAYMAEIERLGALAVLDGIAMHDYLGCPVNGGPGYEGMVWGAEPYVHPNDADPVRNYPNLRDRLMALLALVPKLRQKFVDGPKVFLTEYGLYANDPADARAAVRISRETGVPLILSSPEGPAHGPCIAGTGGTSPYAHQYVGRWGNSMKEFMDEWDKETGPLGLKYSKTPKETMKNILEPMSVRWQTPDGWVEGNEPMGAITMSVMYEIDVTKRYQIGYVSAITGEFLSYWSEPQLGSRLVTAIPGTNKCELTQTLPITQRYLRYWIFTDPLVTT